MGQYNDVVAADADIDFYLVDTTVESRLDAGKRVFGGERLGSSVANDFHATIVQ